MKTKILATIGPASNKRDVLSKLIAAGVRIFRLNFSHGDSSSFVDLIKMIRELEIVHKTPITILQDLSGPKIRIGTFPNEGSLNVLKGDQLLLGPSSLMCNDEFPYIPFDHPEIFAELEQGDRLVLADGTLQFRVVEPPRGRALQARSQQQRASSPRARASPCPGKSIPLPALTEKDKKDLVDGLALGVDAVALSFVQSPEDIREAKSIIRSHSDRDIPVIASSNAATRWIGSTPSSRKSISSWWPAATSASSARCRNSRPCRSASSGPATGRPSRHRRHADAAFDGVQPLPDPCRNHGRRQRRSGRRGLRDALRRNGYGQLSR